MVGFLPFFLAEQTHGQEGEDACGMAVRPTLLEAWKDALAGDPVSAFGGVLICNKKVTKDVADEMHKIFFEVCIAPDYDDDALAVLRGKKNRIIPDLEELLVTNSALRPVSRSFSRKEREPSSSWSPR